VARFLSGAGLAERLSGLPSAEVSFNYLGRFDVSRGSLFGSAAGVLGLSHGVDEAVPHLLELDVFAGEGGMRVDVRFRRSSLRRETVERLVDRFLTTLSDLVAACSSERVERLTESSPDLTGSEATTAELEKALNQVEFE
jgi:non-ribosomal peptide synthase protein (TIGR01720 family)